MTSFSLTSRNWGGVVFSIGFFITDIFDRLLDCVLSSFTLFGGPIALFGGCNDDRIIADRKLLWRNLIYDSFTITLKVKIKSESERNKKEPTIAERRDENEGRTCEFDRTIRAITQSNWDWQTNLCKFTRVFLIHTFPSLACNGRSTSVVALLSRHLILRLWQLYDQEPAILS